MGVGVGHGGLNEKRNGTEGRGVRKMEKGMMTE
jgi:hypothetical protein